MSDIKTIANNYLETAAKLQASSLKWILGISLLVLFCWLFAEQVFYKTKFESIRLNRLEQKINKYKDYQGRLNQNQNNEYDSLKKKMVVQDSVNSDTYKAVEDNVPQPFKFLLKQATHKPFGIFLTSLTTLFFLLYLFNLRNKYLNYIALGLRMIREEEGYNRIFDYNIAIPFWASPIPIRSNNGIEQKDLIIIGRIARRKRSHYLLISLILLLFLVIQLRLYYISLVTNSYNQGWILFVQAISLLFTLSIILIWLLPSAFSNAYNNEQVIVLNSRRNFIINSSFLIGGFLLGLCSKGLSNNITNSLLNPRFHKKKNSNKITDCRTTELKALEALKNGKLEEASEIIYSKISDPKKLFYLKHYTRLFDLLILLCYKDSKIYVDKFEKIISLAKKSNDRNLIAKSISWKNTTTKETQQEAKRKHWDKIEII